jgi:beta-lactamase superfamily II metal-dependent hydrolase
VKKTRGLLILGLALSWLASARLEAQSGAKPLRIDVLDVGQGDSILIRSPEGKAALVDAGPGQEVVSRLKQLGVTSIDMVVVSHHHSDHYGGMTAVIQQFSPRYFLAARSPHTTPSYQKLLRMVRDRGITALRPSDRARKVELGSVELTVLPQPPEDKDEENDNSIGIRVQYGSFSALLTGDSEGPERAWWERHCPDLLRDCTVLKLAHHGSRNGTDTRWLDLVRPRLAVASLGKGNDYGHPHPETLSLLRKTEIPLLRTDQRGTISIQSTGRQWKVLGRNGLATRAPPTRDEAVGVARAGGEPPAAGRRRVDLNRATTAELERLPGIGPATARKIIEGRPYRSIDDLRRVKGVGTARLEAILPNVIVR